MEFTMPNKELADLVQVASRGINSRSPLPVLKNLLIRVQGDGISITGSDLDTTITVHGAADVADTGAVTVEAGLLANLVGKMPAGHIRVKQTEAGRVSVSCEKSRYKLSTLSAEDYPKTEKVTEGREIVLPSESLRQSIKAAVVSAAGSQDESRAVMTGIQVSLTSDRLTMVSTDGRRLSRRSVAISGPEEPASVIVPAKALQEVGRYLDTAQTVRMMLGKNQASFTTDGLSVTTRLLEGRFPDAEKVIPTTFSRAVRIGREDFLAAIKRCLIVAQEKRSPNLLRLTFDAEQLVIRANTPDLGEVEESLAVMVDDLSIPPLTIGFNGKYLADGLAVMDCDEVQFDLQEETKSAILRPLGDVGYDYVVMPVKLRDFVPAEEVAA